MKRTLFPILMTSRGTLSTRAEGSHAQWHPCNHKPEICPWPVAVRGQVLCLKRETISVSVSLPFWSLLPLGSLDEDLSLQTWAGSGCTLMLATLRGAKWLPALCNKSLLPCLPGAMLQSGHLLWHSCARGPLRSSREHRSLLGTGGCLSLAFLVLTACLYVLLHPGLLPWRARASPGCLICSGPAYFFTVKHIKGFFFARGFMLSAFFFFFCT